MSKKTDLEQNESERRASRDRRDFKSSLSDLHCGTDDIFVARDRRKMPERRLSNISVEESEIVEEEFFEYLDNYKNNNR